MYSNKLVVAVKHDNKVLREKSNYVFLLFGSEYALLVKNLNTRKVSVNISIDGEDVLNNKSLLVYPNSETELKGFMDGMTAKNKFKFIQKTKETSNYRGDKIDDGLIRVEFAFEKEKPEIVHHYHKHHHEDDSWYWPFGPRRYNCENTWSSSYKTKSGIKKGGFSNNIIGCCSSNTLYSSNSFNDDGITVKGSEINQDFNYGNIDELEQSHVIIIKLRGEKNDGTIIRKPITVKTKLVCPTCGKKSRSDLRYCSRCGTFLN